MKKSVYTLVFVLCLKCTFCINNSVAQWEQVTNGINSSMNIYSLTSLGSNIFSGSDSGVYISTNNGSSWTITALNNKITYSLAVSGTVIYAGTSMNGVYSTSNNGVNWTQTSLNNQTIYALTNRRE